MSDLNEKLLCDDDIEDAATDYYKPCTDLIEDVFGFARSIERRTIAAIAARRAPAAAAPAPVAAITDEQIESAALEHVAPGWKQLAAVLGKQDDYRQTEQFRRLKDFVHALAAVPAAAPELLDSEQAQAAHIIDMAKKYGWETGGDESAFEFVTRAAYQTGASDEAKRATRTVTHLSHRLRETADRQPGWKPLLTAAADAIERGAAAPIVQPVGDVVRWIRNHYQDYPNVDSLCEALSEALAAPSVQAEPVAGAFLNKRGGVTLTGAPVAAMSQQPGFAGYVFAAPTTSTADAKDAERYRWLRNEAWGGHVMSKGLPHVVEYLPGLMRGRVTELAEEALDAAIDAAIATSADEVKS